jgi:acetyl esterase/lipase
LQFKTPSLIHLKNFQTCYSWKWPLISASYRFLPQIGGDGLYQDAAAAYTFAKKLGNASERKVVVGGASAGMLK